jgi:kynurenine 3-monooxygenase
VAENPVGYLGTIECPDWHFKDKVILLGDSAHTICPFLWQAVNVGLDDCRNLDIIIDKYGFG